MNFRAKAILTASVFLTVAITSSTAIARIPMLVTPEISANAAKTSALVLLGQREILAGDDQVVGGWSNQQSAHVGVVGAPFGLVGAVIAGAASGAIDSSRQHKQKSALDVLLDPIRGEMADLDVDALALKTTGDALQKVGWLNATPITGKPEDSVGTQSQFLDEGSAEQGIFVHYVYFFDPDFAGLHTKVLVEIARKSMPAGGKPEDRLKGRNLAFRQTIDITVPLPEDKGGRSANAAAWAANKADLAHKALLNAFQVAGMYIPRTLNMTAADLSAMYAKTLPKMKYDGDWGQKIEEGDGRTVMWAERLVIIAKLPS